MLSAVAASVVDANEIADVVLAVTVTILSPNAIFLPTRALAATVPPSKLMDVAAPADTAPLRRIVREFEARSSPLYTFTLVSSMKRIP